MKLRKPFFFVCFFLAAQGVVGQGNTIQRKVALVIGIRNYQKVAPLKNSVNDARDMAAVLKKKGFQVIELYDSKTKRELQDGIRTYYAKLQGTGNAVGLLYYSGHGIQVDGVNYLVPSMADPQLKADMDDQCLNMDYIMQALEQASNALNIFIIDACRNSPFRSFGRSAEKGLSMVNAPKGSYIVYSTKPGSVASDGTGRNGLFTSKLLKYLNTPELNIEQVFKRVANDVSIESGDAQRPWISSDYTGDFYFTPDKENVTDNKVMPASKPIILPSSVPERKIEKKTASTVESVVVGQQEWASKNLDVSTFANGDLIMEAKTEEEWKKAGADKTPAWCYYNNDPTNATEYGKLYNWFAVKDPRGLAPTGWHIPGDLEWTSLITFLGGRIDAGMKMKSVNGWNEKGNAQNDSGITALPGGHRNSFGKFTNLKVDGNWWSVTESSNYSAWFIYLGCCSNTVDKINSKKNYGMSVRCIKD